MEKLTEWALKLLPDYLSFLVRFVSTPIAAMRPFSGKDAIEPGLFSFVLVSMVVSWVMGWASHVLILDAAGQRRAIEVLRIAFERFNPFAARWYFVPIALLLLVVGFGLVLHVLAYGYHRALNIRGPVDNDFRLGGSLWDTINAVLGFSALCVPAYVVLQAISTWLYFRSGPAPPSVLDLVSIGVGAGMLLSYLPAALAGAHPNTSFGQAALASAVALGGIAVIVTTLT